MNALVSLGLMFAEVLLDCKADVVVHVDQKVPPALMVRKVR